MLSHLSECRFGVTQTLRAGFCISGRRVVQMKEGGTSAEPLGLGFSQVHPQHPGQGLIWKAAKVRVAGSGSLPPHSTHPASFKVVLGTPAGLPWAESSVAITPRLFLRNGLNTWCPSSPQTSLLASSNDMEPFLALGDLHDYRAAPSPCGRGCVSSGCEVADLFRQGLGTT